MSKESMDSAMNVLLQMATDKETLRSIVDTIIEAMEKKT